jgi:D-sedoheptulose 7-phosphate isomerase
MNPLIKERITESILVKQSVLLDEKILETIQQVVDVTTIALKADKKILLCGNGGSASDAQHIAAELSGRYYLDREPLYAEALHTNTSAVTAIANDYGYDEVFSRLVKSKGRQGDILYALSTSGNSPGIIKAIQAAKERFMIVVGMTGGNGGKMNGGCDYLIKIPSVDTPRIQECHILVGHIICELVESAIFKK